MSTWDSVLTHAKKAAAAVLGKAVEGNDNDEDGAGDSSLLALLQSFAALGENNDAIRSAIKDSTLAMNVCVVFLLLLFVSGSSFSFSFSFFF